MMTRTITFSSSDNFKIMNLPCLSGMTFSTLKFTEGLILGQESHKNTNINT